MTFLWLLPCFWVFIGDANTQPIGRPPQANRIPRKGNKREAGRPGLPLFFFIFVCCRPGSSAAPSPINRVDRSAVFGSCPRIRGCQPPTPRLSCNEKVDWNDGRVSPRNKSFWCRLNASIVRVGKNGEYMTTQPFLPTEDARAHLHWKRIRQHVHRFTFIDVMLEDEFNDRRFFIVDVTISRFVEEITELHRRTPIIEVAAGHCPDRGQVHHRKRQSMLVALLGSSWSSRRRVFL